MNRKQKIIVSVTGIFLVLLILVGLTYAYFLTQIVGNTNPKSISVTTANLQLTYGDGNGVLEVGDKLRPGNAVTFKTSSGTTVSEKTFTVTNNGDDTDYVVIIENVVITDSSGNTTTFKSNDFIYTLTCSSSDSNTCDGIDSSTFPLKDSILVGNKIASGTVHTYTLTMEYKETNQNQSDDMGKTFTARLNIEDIGRINPYSDNTDSLAYNIINNSLLENNGTSLVSKTSTKFGDEYIYTYEKKEESFNYPLYGTINMIYCMIGDDYTVDSDGKITLINAKVVNFSESYDEMKGKYLYAYDYEMSNGSFSGEIDVSYFEVNNPVMTGGKIVKISPTDVTSSGFSYTIIDTQTRERELSIASDDYGISYYYRGDIKDNYVNFANMCWKIVRIQGDGSIKLILEDKDALCNEDIDNDNDGDKYTGNWLIGKGNFGYAYDVNYNAIIDYLNNTDEKSMATFFKTFQNSFTSSEIQKLKGENWCLGIDKEIYNRIYINEKTTFKCNGVKMNDWKINTNGVTTMYVGSLTADEVLYAGGILATSTDDIVSVKSYLDSYAEDGGMGGWWTLSPTYSDYNNADSVFLVSSGVLNTALGNIPNPMGSVEYDFEMRPAVVLNEGITISDGVGTIDDPYVISES